MNCTCVLSSAAPHLIPAVASDDSLHPDACKRLPRVSPAEDLPCIAVCCRGGTAYNENIVSRELVMPQYRIMYNYITVKERENEVRGAVRGIDGSKVRRR